MSVLNVLLILKKNKLPYYYTHESLWEFWKQWYRCPVFLLTHTLSLSLHLFYVVFNWNIYVICTNLSWALTLPFHLVLILSRKLGVQKAWTLGCWKELLYKLHQFVGVCNLSGVCSVGVVSLDTWVTMFSRCVVTVLLMLRGGGASTTNLFLGWLDWWHVQLSKSIVCSIENFVSTQFCVLWRVEFCPACVGELWGPYRSRIVVLFVCPFPTCYHRLLLGCHFWTSAWYSGISGLGVECKEVIEKLITVRYSG